MAFSDPDRDVSVEQLERMAKILGHRGPDSSGFYHDAGIGFGACRLAIIDLPRGQQPFYNENDTVALVCNGEIYNAPELREELLKGGHEFSSSCDVEVMVHLYEEQGLQFVESLRGMFAFALWDSSQRKLVLGRDRLGIKPLYYVHSSSGMHFASEMKALRQSVDLTERLDPRAIRDLFEFGYILAPHTILEEVNMLRPGNCMVYRNGRISIRRYWEFPASPRQRSVRGWGEWVDALEDKLRETVHVHLRSDVPAAAWLSGGVDSSTIAALMAQEQAEPVHTFSLDFEASRRDEFSYQFTLADHADFSPYNHKVPVRIEHFEMLPQAVRQCENMSATGIEIVQLLLARATSQKFKVAMTGEGSDEVFGGYSYYQREALLRPFSLLPRWLRQFSFLGERLPNLFKLPARILASAGKIDLEKFRALVAPRPPSFKQLFSDSFREMIAKTNYDDVMEALPKDFRRWHPFRQLQFFDIKVRLPDFVLRMNDHDAMAYSVETRLPFLDHELLELCARIPPPPARPVGLRKQILREVARRFLPARIANRKKRALQSPYRVWLRGPLPEFAREMLSEKVLRQKGYFSPAGVEQLLERHRNGEKGVARAIMGCLVVQLSHELLR